MKKALLIACILISVASVAQDYYAQFKFNTLPDNSWWLRLYHQNVYKYVRWSGMKGNYSVLDSGKYEINAGKIYFYSAMNAKESFNGAIYCFSIVKGSKLKDLTNYKASKKRRSFNKYYVLKITCNA